MIGPKDWDEELKNGHELLFIISYLRHMKPFATPTGTQYVTGKKTF